MTEKPIHGLPACMGGWCAVRGSCARYHQGGPLPVERLCSKKLHDVYKPIAAGPRHAEEHHAPEMTNGVAHDD